MAFKEVASLDADVTVALGKRDRKTGKEYPKQAEGYYLGNRTVAGKKGPSILHFLQTPKGNLGVWGTTDLNRKMSATPVGTMVRITSTGTKETPKGDMYIYKVEVDASNTIEVELSQSSPAEDDSGDKTGSSYTDTDNDYNDGIEENEDTDDTQTAALAEAAARKAKVEALLRNNKGSKTK